MLVLRFVGILVAIAVAAGIIAFLLTRDRRYLSLSWRIAKYALLFALLVLVLLFAERILAPVVGVV